MRRHMLFAFVVGLCAALLGGCGELVENYLVPNFNPDEARTVLVLPFLDARTLRDDKDPLDSEAAEQVRGVFLEVLRSHPAFARKTVIAPVFDRPAHSLTLPEIGAYGATYKADLVIAGQAFSYVDTRAASIPPRAGMFVRFVSVPEKRLVYVGENYMASGTPGSKGGRDLQARNVAQAILDGYACSGSPSGASTSVLPEPAAGAPVVLVLPYHERPNPVNLIEHTGGGAVVTSLYVMDLAKNGTVKVVEPEAAKASYARLLTIEETLALAKEGGAQYVVRGQVVEFRRAMSVPSWWSAVISTAILAAQVLFAETSGVDIATELYRVEDGACLYARRQISHQKYVVRAEKTVRTLAVENTAGLLRALQHPPATPAVALINSIVTAEKLEDVPEVRAAQRESRRSQEKTSAPAREKKPQASSGPAPQEMLPPTETEQPETEDGGDESTSAKDE